MLAESVAAITRFRKGLRRGFAGFGDTGDCAASHGRREMIITVPFTYMASVRRRRKRNPEDAYFRASVAVEIPEVDGIEAPVAFTQGAGTDAFPQVARWHGDRLWVPNGDERHAGAAELGAMLSDKGRAAVGPHWGNARLGDVSGTTAEGDPSVAEVHGSDHDEVALSVRRELARLLVVDGMAWEASEEPVIKVDWSGEKVWASLMVRSSLGHQTFRLDETHAIPACLPGIDPAEVAAAVAGLGIRVMLPEALRLDTATPVLLETGRLALDRMRDLIADADADYFTGYAALRDAHEGATRAKGEQVGHAVAALADALRRTLEADPARESWAHPGWLRSRVEGALARPDVRRRAGDDLQGFEP